MTATLNNHQEIAGFMKCSMEHTGGPRPVTLAEHVKMGDTVSLNSILLVLVSKQRAVVTIKIII